MLHPQGRYSVEHAIEQAFDYPPMGSEGALSISYQRTTTGNCIAWGFVSIWGDLRDYGEDDDAQRIVNWITNALDRLEKIGIGTRNKAISIEVEGQPEILLGTPSEVQSE
jgi:hypothetical protein